MEFLKNNKYNILIIILWLVLAVIGLINHEIWRDEAQVWCIVRDINIFNIIPTARIEGHPALWYFINLPFAKLSFPVITMQIISLLAVFASVIYLVFKSPFNKFVKTIIILSSGMCYYLPTIARNYCLIPLFLFLLADIYPDRHNKPFLYLILIFILSQTHILVFGLCCVLFALFVLEQFINILKSKNYKLFSKKFCNNELEQNSEAPALENNDKSHVKCNILLNIFPIIILGLFFLFFGLYIFSGAGENYVVDYSMKNKDSIFIFIIKLSSFFLIPNLNQINFFIILVSALILIVEFFRYDKKIALIFIFGNSFVIYVLSKIWFGGIPFQKVFVLFLITLFCYWAVKKNNKTKVLDIIISIFFIFNTLSTPFALYQEYKYNFSGSKEIAQYIRKNINQEDTLFVIGYPFIWSSLSAYLPDKKLYNIENTSYITYFDFGRQGKIASSPVPNAKYYIVHRDFYLYQDKGFKKIYSSSKENLSNKEQPEIFNIYVKE